MTDYLEKRKQAKWKIEAAYHMLTVTYPLIKDPKLLLAVMDSLATGFELGFSSLVYFERFKRTIPAFSDNTSGALMAYKMYVQKKLQLSPKYIKVYTRILEIKKEHKNSPVEFSRDNSFIICDDKYGITKVTPDSLREWIEIGRSLIADIEKIKMV